MSLKDETKDSDYSCENRCRTHLSDLIVAFERPWRPAHHSSTAGHFKGDERVTEILRVLLKKADVLCHTPESE
jgi:hypothetical protein